MNSNHRRDFLKKSILGLSGAALLPGAVNAAETAIISSKSGSELPIRTLGKTGLKIPVLSMGTGDTSNPALVKGALDQGVRLLGTSAYYGNGNNEAMLGGLLKNVPRESYMVATSAMPKGTDHQNGLFTDATAAESFRADVEAGMKRLNVDHLDILFLPFVGKRESVFFEPLLRVMEDFKKLGKARFIGIASHSFIGEALRGAADTGIYDVAMIAYNFKLEQPDAVVSAVDYAAGKGLGLIAMKSMAGGYWDKERTQPISSSAALKWVLQNKNIHTIMSGMTSFDELLKNVEMVKNPEFTEEDKKELKLADAARKSGMFCLQCRECEGQCRHNLDIPTLMRSYMYAYGYRNLHHAQQTVEMVDLSGNTCNQCDDCTVNCKAGFNLKSKISDIARLKDVPSDFLMA